MCIVIRLNEIMWGSDLQSNFPFLHNHSVTKITCVEGSRGQSLRGGEEGGKVQDTFEILRIIHVHKRLNSKIQLF